MNLAKSHHLSFEYKRFTPWGIKDRAGLKSIHLLEKIEVFGSTCIAARYKYIMNNEWIQNNRRGRCVGLPRQLICEFYNPLSGISSSTILHNFFKFSCRFQRNLMKLNPGVPF